MNRGTVETAPASQIIFDDCGGSSWGYGIVRLKSKKAGGKQSVKSTVSINNPFAAVSGVDFFMYV